MPRRSLIAAALAFVALPCAARAAISPGALAEFEKTVGPFFEQHCNRCHNDKKHKGEFRLDTLSRDFVLGGSVLKWADLMDKISSGEMPPGEEKQPPAEEAAKGEIGVRRHFLTAL